jgi:2,3-bisphosphoglycerate-dependent phosphoglycerate mutase
MTIPGNEKENGNSIISRKSNDSNSSDSPSLSAAEAAASTAAATSSSYDNNNNKETKETNNRMMTRAIPTVVNPLAAAAKRQRRRVSPGSSIRWQQQQPQQTKIPSESAESSATQQPQPPQHPAHHFLSGGMPCDPAGPPYHLADYGEGSLYTLVLLRHGESEWNRQNRYTGWCDVDLTDAGRDEARTAGRLLFENNIELDQAFTSVLKRAAHSCNMALSAAHQHWVPVTKSWRINERHYGALQGHSKDTAHLELGLDQELVMQMRRSYGVRPPLMTDDHPHWHGTDRRYAHLTPEQLGRSRAESLRDTAERIVPFFHSVICDGLRAGKRCLIVSHANTIRTLVKHIDGISDEDIKGMTIPTGIPLLYRLDRDLKPVDPQIELEFRYMVEPKGYVRLRGLRVLMRLPILPAFVRSFVRVCGWMCVRRMYACLDAFVYLDVCVCVRTCHRFLFASCLVARSSSIVYLPTTQSPS